jgi:hypothetical protein
MANVTGTLTDFGLNSLSAFSPRILFIPSGPAVSGASLFSDKPLIVVPAADGSFYINLQPTDALMPNVYYTVRIEWLDSSNSYVGVDAITWPLYVPSGGGSIGDLIRVPMNPALVWVDLAPPTEGTETPGSWWLQLNPDDPNDPANTGDLYQWA